MNIELQPPQAAWELTGWVLELLRPIDPHPLDYPWKEFLRHFDAAS